MSGMSVNEPIIYVRQSEVQVQQQQLQLQQQQLQLQQQQLQLQQLQLQQLQLQQLQLQQLQEKLKLLQAQKLHFDYCIFSSGYNQLKIMSYSNYIQDFILSNMKFRIEKEILQNLVDIPNEFGRFKRIKDISRMRINQKIPATNQEKLANIQTIQAIRQDTPAIIQRTPVNIQKSSINKLERKIGDLFNKATITNFKINEKLLTNSIKPIRQRLEGLKKQIGILTEQQLEQQISNIYVNIGQIFENVLRQSQLQRQ
jgi:hypothetical protein